MINQNTEPACRIAPDFTLYLHNGCILVRPENLRAREHLEQHQSDYAKWLFKFHFGDGSSILFGPGPGGGIYLKPKVNPYDLGEKLVERGFLVVRYEQENPAFARLAIGNQGSAWLLHINNCRIPREIGKMIIRGAGKPN